MRVVKVFKEDYKKTTYLETTQNVIQNESRSIYL